jgi:hypothetical protein
MAWCGAALALVTLRCGPIGSSSSGGDFGDDAGASATDSGSRSDSSTRSDSGSPHDAAVDAPATSVDSGSTASGLHVEGNLLVDSGKTVRLLGVNHSGTEYQCVNTGTTIFDGPTAASSLIAPMKLWHVNTVRVPLNEDCWLGINGVPAAVSGTMYQQSIEAFVQLLRTAGMYVIVDLHWNAPGSTLAKAQQPMADEDHASPFWTSVANAFKGDLGIVFDLYNEPHPESGTGSPAACLLNGCSLSDWMGFSGSAQAAGMQELVTTVRATGAKNVLMVGGWSYSNNLTGWLANEPKDPLNNLAASFHNYNTSGCVDTTCWTIDIKPIAAKVPVVTGELGEMDCAGGYVSSYFAWADPLGISYLGWAWNTNDCATFPSLISSYQGTATAFGQAFMTHLPTQN